jgi:DNA-binding IclR family transcriptional regulator
VVRTGDELRAHLAETRRRGYALALDEGEPGTAALATTFRAYLGDDAPVAGTVSIAGPRSRIDERRIDELAPMLAAAAVELAELWPLRRRQRSAGRAARPVPDAIATP